MASGDVYVSRRTPVSIAPTGKVTYGGGGGSPGVPAGSTSSQVLETQKAKVKAVYDPATKTTIAKPIPPSLSQVQQKSNVQIPVNQQYKNSDSQLLGDAGLSPKQNALTRAVDSRKQSVSYQMGGAEITPSNVGVGGGLLFLTPKEAKNIKGYEKPIWVLESTNIKDIFTESKWASSVNINTTPFLFGDYGGLGRSQQILNLAEIQKAKAGFNVERDLIKSRQEVSKEFKLNPESFKGSAGFTEETVKGRTTYSLGVDYFKTLPSYKKYEDYSKMFDEEGFMTKQSNLDFIKNAESQWQSGSTKKQKFKATSREVFIGYGKPLQAFGTEFAEFNVKFMGNIIKTDKEGKIIKQSNIFPRTQQYKEFQSIPNMPLTPVNPWNPLTKGGILSNPQLTGKIFTYSGFGLQGIRGASANVQKYGMEIGLKETIAQTSPIRFQTIFTPSTKDLIASGLMKETIGVKGGNVGGGNIKQYTLGTKGETFFEGSQTIIQTPRGAFGKGVIGTTSPEIRYIGGNLYYGSTSTISRTFFPAEVLGSANIRGGGNVGKGFKANVYSQKIATISYQPNLKTPFEINYFKPSNIFQVTKAGGSRLNINKKLFTFRSGTRTPVYSLEGDSRGWIYSPKEYLVKVNLRGIGITTTEQSINYEGFSSGSKGLGGGARNQQLISKQSFELGSSQVQAGLSQATTSTSFVSKNFLTQPVTSLISTKTETEQSQRKTQVLMPQSTLTTSRTDLGIVSAPIIAPATSFSDRTASFVVQSPSQITTPSTKQIAEPAIVTTTTSSTPKYKPIINPLIILPFALPLGLGGLGFLRTKKYSGKKRYKYTPSYEAFTLGIKGKKPTGIETGLRTRPITPGFSLFNKKSGISAFKGFKGFSGFKGFKASNFKGFNFETINFGTKKKKRKKK